VRTLLLVPAPACAAAALGGAFLTVFGAMANPFFKASILRQALTTSTKTTKFGVD
jgi:hypothetical protein